MIILDPSVLQAQCIFNLKKKKKEKKGKEFRIIE